MTNHATGIGTCTQGMTIPSYLSSEMHLQKIPNQTEFQSWIVNFRAEICAKAKNLALERRVVTKGQNSYTERKTIGSCSRRDNCSFLLTHATGHREIMWKEVGDARRSHPEQASSSVQKVKEQTNVKSLNSPKDSPLTKVKHSLSMVCKMNNIVV